MPVMPAGGEHRRGALRSYRRFKVQPHRATSDQLGGIYPFLAEAGLGSDGVYIGTDSYSGSAFVFDPFVLYQPRRHHQPEHAGRRDSGHGEVRRSPRASPPGPFPSPVGCTCQATRKGSGAWWPGPSEAKRSNSGGAYAPA